ILNPQEPLGTYVFTAMKFPTEGAATSWTVVSMPEELPRGAAPQWPSTAKPSAVIDRIDIPQHAPGPIPRLLRPCSALVVSDHGISDETGNDTDFIVVTH